MIVAAAHGLGFSFLEIAGDARRYEGGQPHAQRARSLAPPPAAALARLSVSVAFSRP